ncbi:MAG: DUF2786 domain-containing protein, partial [Nocardioides sp.]|nr:DUF2786 domain-containing protein [Nocardioides sp.]
RSHAVSTLRSLPPVPVRFLVRATEEALLRHTDRAARGGWGPADLGELTRRRGGPGCVAALATVLTDYAARETWTRPAWSGELDGLGPADRLSLDTVEGLAVALQVAALLTMVPTVEGPLPVAVSNAAHPKLARVRALLAKAESTEYAEEAEAISAKAQELIARYALERLLQRDPGAGHEGAPDVTSRRIWLDAPYVMAKASLVHEVARANRCRSVVTASLGFCLVVGDPADLDAVDLLVTSLLVQANTAMVRHGGQVDRHGASRTRSFRQSFLVAYAGRIGDRLRAAGADAVRETGDEARLLPVLRDQETRVREAVETMLPHLTTKSTTISNHAGWLAGTAAADQALLDVRAPITPRR